MYLGTQVRTGVLAQLACWTLGVIAHMPSTTFQKAELVTTTTQYHSRALESVGSKLVFYLIR